MSRQRSYSFNDSSFSFDDSPNFDESSSLFTQQTTDDTIATTDDEISNVSNNQFFDFDPFGEESCNISPMHSFSPSPTTSLKKKPNKRVTFHESVSTSSNSAKGKNSVPTTFRFDQRADALMQIDLDKKSHGQSAILHSTNDLDDVGIPPADKNPTSMMRKLYLNTMKRLGIKKYSSIGDGNKQANQSSSDGKVDEENTIIFMEESLYTFEASYDSLQEAD